MDFGLLLYHIFQVLVLPNFIKMEGSGVKIKDPKSLIFCFTNFYHQTFCFLRFFFLLFFVYATLYFVI